MIHILLINQIHISHIIWNSPNSWLYFSSKPQLTSPKSSAPSSSPQSPPLWSENHFHCQQESPHKTTANPINASQMQTPSVRNKYGYHCLKRGHCGECIAQSARSQLFRKRKKGNLPLRRAKDFNRSDLLRSLGLLHRQIIRSALRCYTVLLILYQIDIFFGVDQTCFFP